MEYYIDSGNLTKIKELINWLPIDGVTINPSLVSLERKRLFSLIEEILTVCDGRVHVQVLANSEKDIIEETLKLHSFSERIIVKIPVSKVGLAAIKKIDTEEIDITATAVFGVSQALAAAKCGAKYIAPYVSRLDKIEQSGVKLVEEIKKTIDAAGYSSKIIAASIKNANQVKELLKLGIESITLSPEILVQAHTHFLTDKAIEMFEEDWLREYNTLSIEADLKS